MAEQIKGLRKYLFNDWSGCSNHDCIVTGPKKDIGTNGSCSCLLDASRIQLQLLKGRLQTVFITEGNDE